MVEVWLLCHIMDNICRVYYASGCNLLAFCYCNRVNIISCDSKNMYIRCRPNKSGSTTVYLIDSIRVEGKKFAVSKVVKCFGSSKDLTVIEDWKEEALALKARLESSGATSKKFTQIKDAEDITSVQVQEYGIKYLYEHLSKSFFDKMKISETYKKTLKDLLFIRLARPLSKMRTAQVAESFGATDLTVSKIYKMMDYLDDEKIDYIKKYIFKHIQNILGSKISVMFYDLTTIYFETNSKSDLKESGFSKDGKSQHVQISLALIVTEGGMPVGYEIFKGNSFEGATLIPTLEKLRKDYQTEDVTIVADSAMLSAANIQALIAHNFKFIVASRIRNLSAKLTQKVLNHEEYRSIPNHDIEYQRIELDKGQYLIACYSDERRRKDEYDRLKLIEKAKKYDGKSCKNGLNSSLKKSFVKISKDSLLEIDYEKISEKSKLDGYFGFITNSNLSEAEVVAQYKGLWQVEQSFRITKSNLKIRPVYHFVDRRIKAHFIICYLGLTIMRLLEYRLKAASAYYPLESLHEKLRQVKAINMDAGGVKSLIISDIPSEVTKILAALKIPLPPRYKPIM